MSLKDNYILMIASCKKYEKERREGQIKQFLKNPEIMLESRFLSAKMHFYYERLFFWG